MIDCVSVYNMRLSDRNTIESGISSLELIRRAANVIFSAVEWKGRIAIVTGSGNNAADGYALSLLLKEQNHDVTIVTVSDRMHADCEYYASLSATVGTTRVSIHQIDLCDFDMIVDCLLGTGFGGDLKPKYRDAIQAINQSNAYVVSVDINSGMNGDTGEGECVVKSDLTIAIEFIKNGQIMDCAGNCMKRLRRVSIGIELAYPEKKILNDIEMIELSEDQKQAMRNFGYTIVESPMWFEG